MNSARPSPLAPRPKTADAALVIFAKAPIPGQVKTRLSPPLTPDEAATLQGSLVLDMVERSRTVERQLDRFVACSPSREHPFFKIMEGRHGVRLIDQVGPDVGLRMAHVFEQLFGLGYRRVVMVGTDIPSLQASSFLEAHAHLSDHDLVLGPAQDGGYYLIGLTSPRPELFEGIPWSTDQVRILTLKKAETMGVKVTMLTMCRDLDTIEDLKAVLSLIPSKTPKGQQGPISARTAGVLKMLASRIASREPGKSHG